MFGQLFHKDLSQWSPTDVEDVQYFYRCNQFFSKEFTEQKDFSELVKMTYYYKLAPDDTLILRDNKRSVCVILLSGNIKIYKSESYKKMIARVMKQQQIMSDLFGQKETGNALADLPLQKQQTQFNVLVGEFISYNETIHLSSECKIMPMHGQPAEILFVPSFLYNQYATNKKSEIKKIIASILNKIFFEVESKPVNALAESGCKIKQYTINTYIYRIGEVPEAVYIIHKGSIKFQKHGYSYKAMELVVKGGNSMFGDTDILLQKRETSAVCCSSHAVIVQIPKDSFLYFAKHFLPDFKYKKMEKIDNEIKQLKSARRQKAKSILSNRQSSPIVLATFQQLERQEANHLPSIIRVNSRTKSRSKEEQERQYKLIKNSHILLESSSPKNNKIRRKRASSSYSKYPINVLESKIRLFEKLRPSPAKLDLTNRII